VQRNGYQRPELLRDRAAQLGEAGGGGKLEALVAISLHQPGQPAPPDPDLAGVVSAHPATLEHPRYGEYAQNTIARYRELQALVKACDAVHSA